MTQDTPRVPAQLTGLQPGQSYSLDTPPGVCVCYADMGVPTAYENLLASVEAATAGTPYTPARLTAGKDAPYGILYNWAVSVDRLPDVSALPDIVVGLAYDILAAYARVLGPLLLLYTTPDTDHIKEEAARIWAE